LTNDTNANVVMHTEITCLCFLDLYGPVNIKDLTPALHTFDCLSSETRQYTL